MPSVPHPRRNLIRMHLERIHRRNQLCDVLHLHLEPIPDGMQQGAGDVLVPLATLIPQRASHGDESGLHDLQLLKNLLERLAERLFRGGTLRLSHGQSLL